MARETETRMRLGATATLPAYVAALGGSVERVLHAARIADSELRDPESWLSAPRLGALYEAAADELDDPYLGLSFGATVSLQSYGLLSYLVLNASDVATGLNNLTRYSSGMTVAGMSVGLLTDATLARLVFTIGSAAPEQHRQFFESIAVTLCSMMKALVGDEWRPREVCFEHTPAASPAEVARRLDGEVRFAAARNSLAFDRGYLERAVAGADRSLLPIIEKHVNDVVERRGIDPLVSKVRDELLRTLCDGKPSIDVVARRVAMSPRTLQRRLGEKGVRFKTIVNQTRTALAKEYLAQRGITVTETAFLLGYGDLSAFDRAFRREVGIAPGTWRTRNSA